MHARMQSLFCYQIRWHNTKVNVANFYWVLIDDYFAIWQCFYLDCCVDIDTYFIFLSFNLFNCRLVIIFNCRLVNFIYISFHKRNMSSWFAMTTQWSRCQNDTTFTFNTSIWMFFHMPMEIIYSYGFIFAWTIFTLIFHWKFWKITDNCHAKMDLFICWTYN